ncbi:MAG: prepilin-type N-terminal cleavage/methylation domain-containing protein [Planctomycetes bacterium]|nr:prepilin-type N-terminal cleavage/methylation domain-containing protein [Planctomycetota bacterium]
MRGRDDRGFTLIELAIVVAILVFLVAGLAAVCAGVTQRSKVESTRSLVRALEAGCEAYRANLGVFPGSPSATSDTTLLYRSLCVPLPSGGADRMDAPFVVLPSARLGCAPQIQDEWGWPVRYSLPGRPHGSDGSDNSRRFDIDASSSEGGVIGNWPAAR